MCFVTAQNQSSFVQGNAAKLALVLHEAVGRHPPHCESSCNDPVDGGFGGQYTPSKVIAALAVEEGMRVQHAAEDKHPACSGNHRS